MTVIKVRWKDLPDSDRGDFKCRRAVDSSSYIYYYEVWSEITWHDHVHMFSIIASLWRQNDIAASFCRNDKFIFTLCVRWDDIREPDPQMT